MSNRIPKPPELIRSEILVLLAPWVSAEKIRGTMGRQAVQTETLGNTLDQWIVSITSETRLLGLTSVLLVMNIFDKPKRA